MSTDYPPTNRYENTERPRKTPNSGGGLHGTEPTILTEVVFQGAVGSNFLSHQPKLLTTWKYMGQH